MTTYNETALLKTIEVLWGANAIPIAQHIYSVIDKATKDAFAAGYQTGEALDKRDVYEAGREMGETQERNRRRTDGTPVAPREFYGDVMDSSRLGREEVTIQHDSGDEHVSAYCD